MDDITIVDGQWLRLAQAATNAKALTEAFRPIRLEPSGRVVATNGIALVTVEGAVVPFGGGPVYIIPAKRVPPALGAGSLSGNRITFQRSALEVKRVAVKQYPPYERVFARNEEEVARIDYALEVGQLYDLAQGLPTWPEVQRVRVRHRSARSLELETGLDGVRILVSLAGKEIR